MHVNHHLYKSFVTHTTLELQCNAFAFTNSGVRLQDARRLQITDGDYS